MKIKLNKRFFISILLAIPIVIVLSLAIKTNTTANEKYVLEYLEKYNQEFVINEELQNDDDILYAYSISPANNPDIIFTAGAKLKTISYKNKRLPEYFDNYFNTAKTYITEKIVEKTEYILDSYNDIPAITESIYNDMSVIDSELQKLGFDTDSNSSSLDLVITTGNKSEKINFYLSSKPIIQIQLENFFRENN